MADGKHCAHDAACVPVKNIPPFASCGFPDINKVLSELSVNATPDEKARYDAALNVIAANANTGNHTQKPIPCTLPLLDRWFDAKEIEIAKDILDMDTDVKVMVSKVVDNMRDSIEEGKMDEYNKAYARNKLSSAEEEAHSKKSNQLAEIKKNIVKPTIEISRNINTKIQLLGDSFESSISELEEAKGIINKELHTGMMHMNYILI